MDFTKSANVHVMFLQISDATRNCQITLEQANDFIRSQVAILASPCVADMPLPYYATTELARLDKLDTTHSALEFAVAQNTILADIRTQLVNFYLLLNHRLVPTTPLPLKKTRRILWEAGTFELLRELLDLLSRLVSATPEAVASHFQYHNDRIEYTTQGFQIVQGRSADLTPPIGLLSPNAVFGAKAEFARIYYAVFGPEGTDFETTNWVRGTKIDFLRHFVPAEKAETFQGSLPNLRGKDDEPLDDELRDCLRTIRKHRNSQSA